MLAKMSALSLMILEGISVSWNILETSRFKMSLNKSSVSYFWKWKNSMFLFSFFAYFSYSEYAGMFSVFYNPFKNGSLILSEIGSLVTYSGMSRLPTMFEKKVFKTWAVFSSFEIISFSSIMLFFPWTLFCLKEKV